MDIRGHVWHTSCVAFQFGVVSHVTALLRGYGGGKWIKMATGGLKWHENLLSSEME